jgi:hypothetical protein
MGDFKKGDKNGSDEIYSNVVRAGKRTYFFDVRETRGSDHYLTITESKKVYDDEGNFRYEKHKIFLYKEDFEKFLTAMNEAFEVVNKMQDGESVATAPATKDDFTDVDFDSLGN